MQPFFLPPGNNLHMVWTPPRWKLIAPPVVLVIISEGWLSLACRSLISFLVEDLANKDPCHWWYDLSCLHCLSTCSSWTNGSFKINDTQHTCLSRHVKILHELISFYHLMFTNIAKDRFQQQLLLHFHCRFLVQWKHIPLKLLFYGHYLLFYCHYFFILFCIQNIFGSFGLWQYLPHLWCLPLYFLFYTPKVFSF